MINFKTELADLINKHSKENGSNTPDFILAEYLNSCLINFDIISCLKRKWEYDADLVEQDDKGGAE
jgi:hypothetical protein